MSGKEWAEQILEDKKAALSAEESAEKEEKAQALQEAQIRHYYGGALSQFITTGEFPEEKTKSWRRRAGDIEITTHEFALADIDQDGREELLIRLTISDMKNVTERVYDCNPISGELKLELSWAPPPTYYDNGIIKSELHYYHETGELRPFTIYGYQLACDSYMAVASVHDWNKALADEWWADGRPFPDELDTDGDGILYNIYIKGEGEESYEYEDYKYNLTDFDELFGRYTEGAKELSIEYRPMEYESFADFTPAYLKLLAKEAGKGRTDTASDLGLQILNEDYYLDAGDLSYSGDKVGDVTIFGIYPGISVNAARRKLKAYGFYASPYGESKNCLITGEGFGNLSIRFSAEDGIVTDITVRPFCAFAG